MASVSFTGNTGSRNLYLGGIVGWLSVSSNDATVKNCANYGSVTHSGTVSGHTHVGGIVGESSGNKVFIQNCFNYGPITINGATTKDLNIGGILGYVWDGTNSLENCLSDGKITSNKQASKTNYIGSVVGCINSGTASITHCYWSSDVGYCNATGNGSPTINTENSQINFNTTTMDKLNSYNSSWAKWFMLHLNGGSINNLSQPSLVVTQKHFPNPAKEGNAFLFWCLDTGCNKKYDQAQQASQK